MNNKRNLFVIALLIILLTYFLSSCQSEIFRIPIQSSGEFSGIFSHNGEPISLWTDLDVEYVSSAQLWYEIEFFQSGELISSVQCNPFDVKFRLMSRRTTVRGVNKESYLAPMNCEIYLPAGEILISAELFVRGEEIEIFRADLIVNQKD